MKLIEHFGSFLKDEVNLNQSRLDRLEGHVEAVEAFVKEAESFGEHLLRVVRQGSWEHRTIIKPPSGKEFDADLALYLRPVADWEPKDYIESLYQVFREHGTYRDMVHRKSRCVRLDYAGDFHLDIAPVVRRGILSGSYYVQNRGTKEEEETDPEGYTEWLARTNAHTNNNMLVKVTRLVKYLRDIKGTFAVRSILLSTLLAEQVATGWLGDDSDECFPDVATSLVTIFGRLDDFLQESEEVPDVRNPVLHEELFSRYWDETTYSNFRDRVGFYRQRIDDAFEDEDRDSSIRKWRKVFGDSFAASAEIPKSVELITSSALPRASHEKSPVWKVRETERVSIDAYVYDKYKRRRLGGVNSAGRRLGKEFQLRFVARTTADPPFEVYWQVVNTGEEALADNGLRGDLERSTDGLVHWERTLYSGCHWIRCFIIRNSVCVAVSCRFLVLIR